MKIGKFLILAIAATAGVIYYNRFSALSNITDGFSGGSSTGGMEYSNSENSGRNTMLGAVGGIQGGDGSSGGALMDMLNNKPSSPSKTVDSEAIRHGVALLKASAKGDLKEVETLLGGKVKIDMRDNEKRTPLIYASWNGYNDICAKLLSAGANIRLLDKNGFSAYDYAAGRGLAETVALLLKRTQGSDDKHYQQYAKLMQAALTSDISRLPQEKGLLASINRISPEGQSPLHLAASSGYIALAEALVTHGANVNLENLQRQTPLHWAAWSNQAAIIAWFGSKGADSSLRDVAGNTALMLAAENNSTDAAKALLQLGAKKTATNKQGKTAEIIAEDKGHKELAELLR